MFVRVRKSVDALGIAAVVTLLSSGSGLAHTGVTRTVDFRSHDNLPMFGKLTLPPGKKPAAIVIYIQTAEGMTVDMRRLNGRGGTFDYFDLYRDKLPEMNVGFFSYEGRGCLWSVW